MPATPARATPRTRPSPAERVATPPPRRRPREEALIGAPLERVMHVFARLKERRRTSAATLMAEWGVSRSTVRRDLDFMRDRLGMPIEWDNIRKTFHFSRPCETLPCLVLGPREALTLALAGRVCEVFHGAAFASRLDAVLRRLAPMLGGSVSIAVEALQHVHTPQTAGELDEFEHFLPLLEAIEARRPLALTYAKPDAPAPEKRRIHPLHLARLDGRWQLIAHDPARGELRHFLLARIQRVVTAAGRFERPPGFDPARHLAGGMGAFVGDGDHDVRLALSPHAAAYACERPWHPSQRTAPRPDGRTELRLRVNHLAGVRTHVLRWAAHVEVLAPPELRAEVHAALRAACAHYEG